MKKKHEKVWVGQTTTVATSYNVPYSISIDLSKIPKMKLSQLIEFAEAMGCRVDFKLNPKATAATTEGVLDV